ncbi:vacuolar protein sorting 11 [Phakopsora pachyrhizi]|uniref:Vacuolar protein sorting 11 n=1 Tax=Phakopsora pachyrhizi TaxID=170000 RepID=A0AAV0B3D7_PHAPC|nr:vacuolar protein sorting 11 [Phakopsora pachyrhizi]
MAEKVLPKGLRRKVEKAQRVWEEILGGFSVGQWRQLNFFESYPVHCQDGSDPVTVDRSSDGLTGDSTSSILDISSGFGSTILGRSNGLIELSDRSFRPIRSWSAYPNGRCTFVRSTSIRSILVSIGEEPGSSFGVLKVWNLRRFEDDGAKSSPQLIGYSKIQVSSRPYPVTALALTPSLSYLSIGLADGTVILYRQLDQALISTTSLINQPNTRSIPILPKPKIILNSPEPITGLGFKIPRAPRAINPSDATSNYHQHQADESKVNRTSSRGTFLYIVTTSKVLCFLASSNSINSSFSDPLILDDIGASVGCSKVIDNDQLVLGDQEALYFYGPEGRGACLAYQSKKIRLEGWSNYLFMICSTSPSTAAVPKNSTASQLRSTSSSTELIIFDIQHRFIAYSNTFKTSISHVWSEWDEFFILTGSGKIIRLVEKSFSDKLKILYEKDLYILAINLAKSLIDDNNTANNNINENSLLTKTPSRRNTETTIDSYDLSKIFQTYGDYLYEKSDFEGSVQQYVQTIGILQPSFVIRKFLDAQRISNLTFYLQELHSRGVANSDHTTLLLNCYTKLKDHDRLDDFIKTNNQRISKNNNQLPFDLETAIKVCRQAGYFEHALYLAKQYNQDQDYLRIQIEDRSEWLDALNYMRALGRDGAESNLLKYGKPLLANLPEDTTDLMIDVCCKPRWSPSINILSTDLLEDKNNSKSIKDNHHSHSTSKKYQSEVDSSLEKKDQLPQLRQFFAFFIDEPRCFIRFLETVAEKRWNERMTDEMIEEDIEQDSLPGSWLRITDSATRTTREDSISKTSNQPSRLDLEDERIEDVEDREAVWGTLLELYLQSSIEGGENINSERTGSKMEKKALSLLRWGGKNSKMRYEPTQALIVCLMNDFVPGIILLYEKLGMIEEMIRFWIDRKYDDDSREEFQVCKENVLKILDQYGSDRPELYPIVLRFLASNDISSDQKDEIGEGNRGGVGVGDLERVLNEIESRKMMSTIEVIETLSKDGSLTCIGTIKNYLIKQVIDQQNHIQSDQRLIESYKSQSKKKENEVESIKKTVKVFQLNKCCGCLNPLELPVVHFMCQHSFHQRCLGDQDHCLKCGNRSTRSDQTTLNLPKTTNRASRFNSEEEVEEEDEEEVGVGLGKEEVLKEFIEKMKKVKVYSNSNRANFRGNSHHHRGKSSEEILRNDEHQMFLDEVREADDPFGHIVGAYSKGLL